MTYNVLRFVVVISGRERGHPLTQIPGSTPDCSFKNKFIVLFIITFGTLSVCRCTDSGVDRQQTDKNKNFTARRYASAILAMALCLFVCLSVCHKSVFYRNVCRIKPVFWPDDFLRSICYGLMYKTICLCIDFSRELCPKLRTWKISPRRIDRRNVLSTYLDNGRRSECDKLEY